MKEMLNIFKDKMIKDIGNANPEYGKMLEPLKNVDAMDKEKMKEAFIKGNPSIEKELREAFNSNEVMEQMNKVGNINDLFNG